jgi:hypothetical protein
MFLKIYPIVSAYVTEDEYDEVYEYAISEPHDFFSFIWYKWKNILEEL